MLTKRRAKNINQPLNLFHVGRLNMLVNVCRKQLTDVFAQFKPMEPKEPVSPIYLVKSSNRLNNRL